MMALFCAFTVSCGDDDENEAGGNAGGSEQINTSNSALTSRLKDKDGNPVLLEGIKDSEGYWILKYDYNRDGTLAGFQTKNFHGHSDSDTTVINGLSYTSKWVRGKNRAQLKVHVTLNEQGLIS